MKSVQDPFTDDQHKEWDNTLLLMGMFRMEFLNNLKLLLSTIVNVCGLLNSTYSAQGKCDELLKKYPSLLEELKKARAVKSYRSIRILEILQKGYKEDNPTINRRILTAEKAWKVPYVGRTSTLLHHHIDNMNRDRGYKPYQNTATILQSSGTGKSRTVDHLGQSLFTLPFCLRNAADASGYPPPDTEVRKFFTATKDENEVKESHDDLMRRFLLFFAHLFRMTRDWITQQNEMYQKLAGNWYGELSNSEFRKTLYGNAITKATDTPISFDLTHTIEFARDEAKRLLSLLEDRAKTIQSEQNVKEAVRLFMYFDESHYMTEDEVVYTEEKGFKIYRTGHIALLSALNVFAKENIFSMFLSTKFHPVRYKPTPRYFSSSRGTSAEVELQAPFVEMPFDEWEQQYILEEYKYSLEEVCQAEFMIRFGRPLFWTWWKAGDNTTKNGLVDFASCKLKNTVEPEDESRIGDIAALSLRLLLEFEPKREKASLLEGQLVAGNMRIAVSVPSHGEYMRSATPSEPILAEAAAYIMTEDKLKRPIQTLMKYVNDDLISKGERGELVARLLLILAHDAAVQNLTSDIQFGIKFSRPILLLDFLDSLFQPEWMPLILKCRAENVSDSPTLKEAFEGAKIHFTHFGKAESPAMLSDKAAWIAMSRGMAWQFYNQQFAADIGIPILLWDKALGRYVMSILVIQVKNRKRQRSLNIDLEDPNCRFFTTHLTDISYNTRPYITLYLQLGVQPSAGKRSATPTRAPRATAPAQQSTSTLSKVETGKEFTRESLLRGVTGDNINSPNTAADNVKQETVSAPIKHPRYSINVLGCSSTVFKVIDPSEKDSYAELLASCDFLEEHPRQEPDFLDPVQNFKATWHDENATYQWCGLDQPSRLVEGTDSYGTTEECVTVS